MERRDKPALMRILQNTPEFKALEMAVAEEVIDSYLGQPGGYRISIAEADSEIAGYICYGRTPLTESTWDIYWLAVDRLKQGRGLGGALLQSAEEEIRKEGGRLVIIETSMKPGYEKTLYFYMRHNYRQVCRIADFYAPGDDKIVLQKRLGQD